MAESNAKKMQRTKNNFKAYEHIQFVALQAQKHSTRHRDIEGAEGTAEGVMLCIAVNAYR